MKEHAFDKACVFKAFVTNQTMIAMKLTVLFTLFACLQVNANLTAQKISLQKKNATLTEVFKSITEQTGFNFFFNDKTIQKAGRVTVDVKNATIEETLKECFKNQPLTYVIKDKVIVISTKEESAAIVKSQEESMDELPPPIEVTGRVLDEEGNGVEGVSVSVSGTSVGVSTDAAGNFRITVADNSVLHISHVAYQSQEIPVRGRRNISVVLRLKESALKDVVVVGYGTQRKVTLTGAVTQINAEQLNTTTNANLTNMMSGKMPGLRVVQRTSEPGRYENYIDIRGMGGALVIVDGVVRSDYNRLDPNEIESVSILKDASAAVYGVQSANGVMLITTKKGKPGRTEFSYSGTVGWANITNTPKVGSAVDWMNLTNEQVQNENLVNSIINPNFNPRALTYSDEQIQQYKDGTKKSTDWANLALRDFAPQQQHNLSIRGGSEKVKYFVSMGYFDEMGLWKSGDLNYKRYNFRTNLSTQITKDLEAEFLINGIIEKTNEPGGTLDRVLMFKSMWMQIPTLTVYANNNPDYLNNAVADGTHPLAITSSDMSGYINALNKNWQGTAALNYRLPFLDGLKARVMYSYYNQDRNVKTYKKKYPLYNYNAVTDVYTPVYQQTPSYITESYSTNYRETIQASLNYEKKIDDHNIKAMVLFEQRTDYSKNFTARRDLELDAIDQLGAGTEATQRATAGNPSDISYQGFVGRVNYDFRSKYLFEYACRYDASSKFPPSNRWAFFPSVLVGWRISEEKFIKNNNSFSFIDNLKIRGSWGKLGDDGALAFQYLTGYTYPSGNYVFENGLISGLGFQNLPNNSIFWIKAATTDVGIEGSLWNSKLKFEFDIFRRRREGLLATRNMSLPNTVGATLPQENLNSDITSGYEITLGHSNMIGDFKIDISANMAYARTKTDYQERAMPVNSYDNWRNNSWERWNNIIWGYHCLGQFKTFDEIYAAPVQDGNGNKYLLPGDLKYQDINNDGIIDSGDQLPIGRGTTSTSGFSDALRYPELTYGITIGAGYKGFDLTVLMQGCANFDVIYGGALQTPLRWGRNSLDIFNDRWHLADIKNPNGEWTPGKYPAYRTTTTSNYAVSDFWLQDASWFRVKSIELGYTFPQNWFRKVGIRNLRLYANGFNMFTWTKIKFIDPEQTPSDNSSLYPITRNFNVGVNLSF